MLLIICRSVCSFKNIHNPFPTLSSFGKSQANLLNVGLSQHHFTARVLYSSVNENMNNQNQTNVLGGALNPCSMDPITGFYRTGFCACGPGDYGVHSVCASLTAEFLEYTKSQGNDLSTPRPEFGFPGLKPGDRWCLCASRWKEAMEAGCAPNVILEATNSLTTEIVPLEILEQYALSAPQTESSGEQSHDEL